MPNQSYRLVIKSADGLSDALVVTSIRGGTNPYIAAPPSGDGQEVDLLTGAVRSGSYVVEVVDAATGTDGTGTIRVVTNKIYDASDIQRPQLLSRQAFVEMSTDNGLNWTRWMGGYVTGVEQIDAIRYAVTVSDSRRVEQTLKVFSWSDAAEQTAFQQRGCIFGGPVIGGFGAKPTGGTIALDTGGWEFELLAVANAGVVFWDAYKPGYYLSLKFIAGSVAPTFTRQTALSAMDEANLNAALTKFVQYDPGLSSIMAPFGSSEWLGLTGRAYVNAYPNLTAIVTDGTNEWRGSIPSMFSAPDTPLVYIPGVSTNEGGDRLFVRLYDGYVNTSGNPTTPLPATGTTLRVRVVSTEVTPESPLYFDLHPVDVVTKLYDIADIPYLGDVSNPSTGTGSLTWIKDQLGVNLRLAARITEPVVMAEFLEKSIFGPFGFAARTNGNGVKEFFITRELGTSVSYTITNNDIVGDAPPPIWMLDESTAVTGFMIRQKQYTQWVQPQDTTIIGPPDNIVETAQPIAADTGDVSTFSTRVVEYDIPGMVHDAASFTPNVKNLAYAIGREGFDRFGRGAASSEIPVLRTSAAAAAQVGDLVYISASYYPNKNYRIGESSVGSRIAQVVRREERPESVLFKLVDAGSGAQPATLPQISIAASTANGYRVAAFTIDNAATLNSAGNISVAVEYATGASSPTAGTIFARYEPGKIPTAAVYLPSMVPGTRVYVRARSEQVNRTPSSWSAWAAVTLTAWVVPTSLTSTTSATGAILSWSNNGNTTDGIQVYLAPGSVAPSDWTPYRVLVSPPGTTRVKLGPLTASTAYIAAIAFVDAISGARGSLVTTTFTTASSNTVTAARPASLSIVPGVEDIGLWTTGIQLATFSAVGEEYTVIERAPNTTPGGIDTPGTYVQLAIVPASQMSYIDYLPTDNTRYWYRTFHRTTGRTDSSYTTAVSGVPQAIFSEVFTVSPVAPVIAMTTTESGTTATVTIGITDPQNRVTQVRFRERTNGGAWSAWTVDSTVPYSYSGTIPSTGFLDIEYEVTGYNGAGASAVLAAGVESFDLNTTANLVSVAGTFTTAGALVLGIQADTDTASFKYAVATTDWASDAAAYTAAQAGTLVNARNSTITLTGPYSIGTTVYVACAAYTGASGAGTVSGPFRYSFINGSVLPPTLSVVTTPGTSSYSVVVTWDGTIAYSLDGVSQSVSGWTSPRTVTITRNDYLGASQNAAFSSTRSGITIGENVTVPPKDNANASITIGAQTADDTTDDYEFSWSTSGFPTGTTYNLTYTTTTTAGVVEQGSLTNQTSPVTVASGFNIGASPTYQMRIDAIKSGTLVLTASRSGTFVT